MKDMLSLDDSKLIGDEYHAWKTIPTDAIFFEGHYPGNKILPGVFHLELVSITAKKFLCDIHKNNSQLIKVMKYRFFKSVLPAEIVTIKLKLKERGELGWIISANLYVENERVSTGIIVMGERIPEPDASNMNMLPEMATTNECMGLDKIIRILPHRYPFLQLDRVINIIGMEKIIGLKNISASDHMLWGRDILSPFPQSIMIEALSQCAGILGLQLMTKSGVALFGFMTNVSFTGSAFPGDQLIFEASVIRALSDSCIMSGRIWVKNRLICDIENMVSAVR